MCSPTARQLQGLLVAAVIATSMNLAACTNANPVSSTDEPVQVGAVAVPAAALESYDAGVYRQLIGKDGGRLDFGVGDIVFPMRAVQEETMMTASVDGHSVSVVLGPEGVEFPLDARPVLRFRISPRNSDPAILYVDKQNVVLGIIPGRVTGGTMVEAKLAHFSKYIFGVE